jgi:hypothetical protein
MCVCVYYCRTYFGFVRVSRFNWFRFRIPEIKLSQLTRGLRPSLKSCHPGSGQRRNAEATLMMGQFDNRAAPFQNIRRQGVIGGSQAALKNRFDNDDNWIFMINGRQLSLG